MLEERAITDSLTGLHNRRHLLELCDLEFQRARRYQHPLSIVMTDVDRFKQVNDTYGHDIGDLVLKTVARSCREQLRNIDLIGRYGGDEFVILLIEFNLDAARGVAERCPAACRRSTHRDGARTAERDDQHRDLRLG